MNRLLACGVLLAGCQYDYDKLYQHASEDAGMPQLTSSALIANWIGHMPLDQACISCAEANCAEDNAACLADPQCVAYTQCVGAEPTPAGQARCREQFAAWVNDPSKARERDLGGPYGQCVFRYSCTPDCTGDSELWCAGEYTMPTTSETTVPLSLYLVDAIRPEEPVANANVRACSVQNPRQCTDVTAAATGVTDSHGYVRLELPTSFNRAFTGYLQITGADRYPTLLKFSWNFGQPNTQVVSILADGAFKAALSAADLVTDDTRGMLQLRMLGCQGAGIKGAFFSLQDAVEGSRTWYIVGGLPRLDNTGTSEVGSGGIIDIPGGTVKVNAKTSDGTLISEADAPVRAGFMTVVIFVPKGKT